MIYRVIEDMIHTITDKLTAAAVSPQVNALETVLYLYLTVWILFRGYMILAGKSQDPIKDLLFDFAIKAAVITIIFSPTWITLISNAIDGLNSWASGSTSLFGRMDDLLKKTFDVSSIMIDQDRSMVPIAGYFSAMILISGFVVFSFLTIFIIASTTIMLKILIMLTPIMLATTIFKWIKDVFASWIRLIVANTLTVLIVGMFINTLDKSYENVIDQTRAQISDVDLLMKSFEILILTLFLALAILIAKEIAQQLASASIEHLPQSLYGRYGNWKYKNKSRKK